MPQEMYDGCETIIRSGLGVIKGFGADMGLHQGFAVSLLLFAVVMDRLTTYNWLLGLPNRNKQQQ